MNAKQFSVWFKYIICCRFVHNPERCEQEYEGSRRPSVIVRLVRQIFRGALRNPSRVSTCSWPAMAESRALREKETTGGEGSNGQLFSVAHLRDRKSTRLNSSHQI